MNKNTEAAYNNVPYFSKSFYLTFPNMQKSILQLLDFSTPCLENARVLEIGCSFGGNIIPFAIANPNAKILGIDLAEKQVNEGNKIIKLLELDNIELQHKNIMDFDETYGEFDYIICHGVFSWVNKEVQDKILDVIKNHLSKNGSALISYNTYPGWKFSDIFKDMMNFRIDVLSKNGKKLQAYEIAKYGKEAAELLENFSLFPQEIKNIGSLIKKRSDYYILHEYFEENNIPMYLYEFNEKLKDKELSYIVDTDISVSFPKFKNPEVEKMIDNECKGDHVAKEQYCDYLFNREFRRSIITHKENTDKINLSGRIKIDNLNKINIRGFFQKNEDGTYTKNNFSFSNNFENIIEEINNIFPNTVRVRELAHILKRKNKYMEDFYQKIISLIYSRTINVFTNKIEIKKETKLKLNEKYRKYINYILSTEQPVISFSNFMGVIIEASEFYLKIMLLFNGERTDNEIEEIILENIKNGSLSLEENMKNSKKTNEEIVKKLVEDTRDFLEKNLMN